MSIYLSVIIPAYNEEHRMEACLKKWTDYLWEYTNYKFEVIVADNGSTDGTVALVQRWQDQWPQIRLIRIPQRGKGAAIMTGMLAAWGSYRYMADVDLAVPPSQVERFLVSAQAGGNPVVIGYRLTSSLALQRVPHHLAFKALAWLVVPGTRDTQCGFKLFRADAANAIFGALQTTGLAFDVEAILLARKFGYRITELLVPWTDMPGSVIRPKTDAVDMLKELLAMRRRSLSWVVDAW